MAKKKITTEETIDTEKDIPPADTGAELTQEEVELSDFLDGFAGTANQAKIFKVVEGKKAYCGTTDLISCTEENILKKWGGGEYVVMPVLNGKFVTGATRRFTVFAPPDDPFASRPIHGANDGTEFALLKEQLKNQNDLLIAVLTKEKEPAPQGPTTMEILQMLTQLQGMAPKGPGVGEIMSLIKDGIELVKDNVMPSDGKTDWPGLIMKALDKAGPMIGGMMAAKARAAQAGAAPAIQAAPAMTEDEMFERQIIGVFLGKLKKKCLEGRAAQDIVDWMLDNLEMDPETYQPMIGVLMNRPFEYFVSIDPQIAEQPFKLYFESIYNGLKQEFSKNAQVDTTTGEGGGSPDITGNEAADPGSNS